MAFVPAICNSCGTVFQNTGIELEGNWTLQGCLAGPCPNCGGMGTIADGRYQAVGNVLRIIASGGRSRTQIEQLQRILLQAQTERPQPQAVVERIQAEAPELEGLAGFFQKFIVPKNSGEFWTIVGTLLTALSLWLAMPNSQPEEQKHQLDDKQLTSLVAQVVAATLTQAQATQQVQAEGKPVAKAKKKKTGRNAPCPCSSGKKYKMCCINQSKSGIR